MVSPRVLKLAEDIKVIAAEMLKRRIKDPRLGFVTLTDVRLTGDSRDASVFYTRMWQLVRGSSRTVADAQGRAMRQLLADDGEGRWTAVRRRRAP